MDDMRQEIERLRARLAKVEALLREALDAWTGDGPSIEIDRIRAALKAGEDVPGARLVQSDRLEITA